jgi:hypothetical protein
MPFRARSASTRVAVQVCFALTWKAEMRIRPVLRADRVRRDRFSILKVS